HVWRFKMKIIQFSGQYGGGGNTEVPRLQRRLNAIFFADSNDQFSLSPIEYFSIVFRVSGPVRDFGYEGPERLKKVRGKNIITIDFSIPEARWKTLSGVKLRKYLAEGIEECFIQLLTRAEKQYELNRSELEKLFRQGLTEFLNES
ncbi:hypothetical protein ACQ9T7_004527, partial [Vibrio parahaemolyticus]